MPLRERPSSAIVQVRPARSSRACRRETRASHSERDVGAGVAPDGQLPRAVAELDDPLGADGVAEEHEGNAAALGLDPLLELGGRRAVQPARVAHRSAPIGCPARSIAISARSVRVSADRTAARVAIAASDCATRRSAARTAARAAR